MNNTTEMILTLIITRYAGGGYSMGVCAGAGADMEIAKVFSANTLDDGGVSSGASIGGKFQNINCHLEWNPLLIMIANR